MSDNIREKSDYYDDDGDDGDDDEEDEEDEMMTDK